MVEHLITWEETHQTWFNFDTLSSMILFEMSKMVPILAWVIELETFILSAHVVLGAGL
jgi:hypothetical protein